jgi:hypothetical protein
MRGKIAFTFIEMKKFRPFFAILLLLVTILNIAIFLKGNLNSYTERFNPILYRKLYGESQYVSTAPKQMLPDEIVYSLAGWEYIHGVNPAIFNADQPPLGKYFIGLSEIWFNNPRIPGPFFNILCLVALFILSNMAFENYLISVALVTLFSFEKIFIAQMKYAPLLDNIQLFFILLSFIFFLKFVKSNKLLVPAFLSLGAVASTKFWATALIIYLVWFIYLLLFRNLIKVFRFIIFSPAILITMLLSYLPAFLEGSTLKSFFGVQKYIYSFHHDKLNFDPLSVWDLLLFNRWHSFSGIRSSVDWQWTWPIITILSLIAISYILKKKLTKDIIGVFVAWFIIYFLLLSSSSILSRYLIPVLPAMYILSFWLVKKILK